LTVRDMVRGREDGDLTNVQCPMLNVQSGVRSVPHRASKWDPAKISILNP
jgi:hypothetical protein